MSDISIGPLHFTGAIWQWVYSAGILVLFLFLDAIAFLILHKATRRLTHGRRNQVGRRLVHAVRRQVYLIIFVQGVFLATAPLQALDPWAEQIRLFWSITLIILVGFSCARLASEFFTWYGQYVAPRRKGDFTSRLIPGIRRISSLVIYIIAAMLILDQLSISITPLIAGFGIGGLAVALALQPTLSNFFAGTYLVSGDILTPGDYVSLETGLTGYIVEVGWRSTRLRTPYNNLVVIPNSRLADSILTNYYGPSMAMGVIVEAGVSYDSDLAHVERVALEVTSQLIEELDEAKKPYTPWFGFERFGDSNIDFWVWLEAKDLLGSFKLKSELIKRLHQRFANEGIVINYPVRKIVYASENDNRKPIEIQELRSTEGSSVADEEQSPTV
jgi:small-conductance mechanosensitive channel